MALTVDCLKPIYPKYEYKYTDNPRRACATYLSDSNAFNLPPPDAPEKKPPTFSVQQITVDWKGRDRGRFLRYNATGEETMCTKTTDDCKPRDPVICRGRTRTRCTQTRYRESSAQTHPYLPEIAGNRRKYENFEIYQIAKLLDTCTPPGAYEAKVVERARRRLQFEKALKEVADDKVKSQVILEAMEWQNWIAREEDIQSIQMLRMEIVQKLFKERESNFTETSQKRIELGANRIQAKQKAQLKKIDVEYLRAMRQLEAKRQNIAPNYRKGNIAENHVNPASDLRAPQMRFGVNPNRRHFISFRKNFDDRIDELDKRRVERGLSALECPFSKLRTWAKPKERMKEVSQRFCSEENLKNLYESLKSLRATAEAQKSTPKCLKKKEVSQVIAEEVLQRKTSQVMIMTERGKRSAPSESVEFTGIKDEPEQVECLTEQELLNTLRQRRSEEVAHKIRSDLLGILAQYEGSMQGKLLKFLRDELERLNQMKKFQAIQMIAEKERWRREATEAGRRQKENKLREDNEVLYTATSTVRNDLSTIFLKSVLEEEFEFSAEALTTVNIEEMAKSIDKDEMDPQGKDKRSLYRAIISDSLNNQVFKVVEKKLEKMRADQQLDADIKALTEELYRSVEDALNQRYVTADSIVLVGELLDELIHDAVTYDFNLFTPDTSDDEFYPEDEVGAIIDKLLRNVVRKVGTKEDFIDASEWQTHLDAKREAAAVIRKLIRRMVPAERWKHHSERVVEQTLSDTFNAAVYEVECLKTSRIVCADDRLRAAISEVYSRMSSDAENIDATPSMEPVSSKELKSIPSTIELFDYPRYKSVVAVDSEHEDDEFSGRKINYVDPNEWVQVEPAELGRRHERYNIMGKVAKRYRRLEPQRNNGDSSSSQRSTTSSLETPTEVAPSQLSSYLDLDALHPDFATPGSVDKHRPLMSASSYEKACLGYERLNYRGDADKHN